MRVANGFPDSHAVFPTLMRDSNKGVIIFANTAGTGMVLDSGKSLVLNNGDIIFWVQTHFLYEVLQFSPMQVGERLTIIVKDM